MFDFNKVNVGDYVETRKGETGYVERIITHGFNCDYVDICYRIGENKKRMIYSRPRKDLNKSFKQIGTYVFEDKNKIEPLWYEVGKIYSDTIDRKEEVGTIPHLPPKEDIVNKINEIIKWINGNIERE